MDIDILWKCMRLTRLGCWMGLWEKMFGKCGRLWGGGREEGEEGMAVVGVGVEEGDAGGGLEAGEHEVTDAGEEWVGGDGGGGEVEGVGGGRGVGGGGGGVEGS
jgi:hypothetical protein